MNLTLVGAVAMVVAWGALVFVVGVPSGWVHLLYVGAVLLFTRRILLGAPKFVS